MATSSSTAELIAATRKAVLEGESLVGRARSEHGLAHDSDDDGPRTTAWKQGKAQATIPASPIPIPSFSEMIENIVCFERAGRPIAAALGLTRLREHYAAIDLDELPADERSWSAFTRKRVPLPPERIDELIGRMLHRGGILRCTKCGTGTACACGCGAPYVNEHRAMPAVEAPASALERASAAVAAHPEKSNRALAAEIGVAEPTVRRARRQIKDAAVDDAVDDAVDAAPESRVGRDGRRRRITT